MPEPGEKPAFDALLRTMRIILVALCLGVIVLAAVLISIRDPQRPMPAALPIVTYVGVALAVVQSVMAVVVPGLMANTTRKQLLQGRTPQGMPADLVADPLLRWAMVYQTGLIVSCGLLEGAAFLQLIAYFLEGQVVSLGVAGALLVLLVFQYPTRDAVTSFAERQEESLAQEKQALG